MQTLRTTATALQSVRLNSTRCSSSPGCGRTRNSVCRVANPAVQSFAAAARGIGRSKRHATGRQSFSLFPAGNADVAAFRQAALLVAPQVNTAAELLRELRNAITQPELP